MERFCYNCGQPNAVPDDLPKFFCAKCGKENVSASSPTTPDNPSAQPAGQPPPYSPHTQAPQPAPPNKKSNKGLIIGGVVLAFIVIGLIGSAFDDPVPSESGSTGSNQPSAQGAEGLESPSETPSEESPSEPSDDPSKTNQKDKGGSGGTASKSVPDVVGQNLQRAQDLMQAAGYYNLHSYDVTGESSFQVIDRNWRVVEQTPPAGTQAGPGKYIDLGVVER